jgi:hypothetical protein
MATRAPSEPTWAQIREAKELQTGRLSALANLLKEISCRCDLCESVRELTDDEATARELATRQIVTILKADI